MNPVDWAAPLLRRVLVPIDFAVPTDPVLDYAALIANGFEAEMHVLYVWSEPARRAASVETIFERFSGTAAGRRMATFLETLEERTRTPVRGRLALGEPASAIVRIATSERYDLIILGAGQHGSLRRLIGGVAEKVTQRAPCPVLSVRRPFSAIPQAASEVVV